VRNHRGSPKGLTKAASTLRSWLLKHDFAVKLGGEGLRLTAPITFVLDELHAAVASICERGLRPRLPAYSEAAFKAALRSLRVAV
jgi:hypothetical protein